MSEGSFPPNSASSDRTLRGIALTLAGGALWGVNGTVSKYIMATYDVDPLWFVCVKELTACWLFLAMAALRKRASLKEVLHTPRALAGILRFAIGAILFSQVAYLEAINWTNAGTATVLQSLSMALVLVVVCIRSKRRPRRREALGLVLAFAGTYLVATGGSLDALIAPGWPAVGPYLCCGGGLANDTAGSPDASVGQLRRQRAGLPLFGLSALCPFPAMGTYALP